MNFHILSLAFVVNLEKIKNSDIYNTDARHNLTLTYEMLTSLHAKKSLLITDLLMVAIPGLGLIPNSDSTFLPIDPSIGQLNCLNIKLFSTLPPSIKIYVHHYYYSSLIFSVY